MRRTIYTVRRDGFAWYPFGMTINDLHMRLTDNPTGAPASAGGRAASPREREDEGAGYGGMFNDDDLAGAREIRGAPLPIFPTSDIPSSERPMTLSIPKEKDDLLSCFSAPQDFQPHETSMVLADARKNFFPKVIDEQGAASLASALVAYFSRPLTGFFEKRIFLNDGTEEIVKEAYELPLPLLAEFANAYGMTEAELKYEARNFPATLGRAVQFAKDVLKTKLIRGGLTEKYNPQITVFTATNETDMKAKTEHTEKHVNINDLLDRIEKTNKPITYAD